MIVKKEFLFRRADGLRKHAVIAELDTEKGAIAFRFKNPWHKRDMTSAEWSGMEDVLNELFAEHRPPEPENKSGLRFRNPEAE